MKAHYGCFASRMKKQLEAKPNMTEKQKLKTAEEVAQSCIDDGKVAKGGPGAPERLAKWRQEVKELGIPKLYKEVKAKGE